MRIARNLNSAAELLKGQPVVLTIGNFDGLHIGHQKLIRLVRQIAEERKSIPLLLSFYPHPREFFSGQLLRPILPLRAKLAGLKQLGIDRVWLQHFCEKFAEIRAQQFLQKIFEQFDLRGLVLGSDVHVGAQREGDLNFISQYVLSAGCTSDFIVVPDFEMLSGSKIGTRSIRTALTNGDLDTVAASLGRPYSISGEIFQNQQQGRRLGFSTINIDCSKILLPPLGVYVSSVKFASGKIAPAVSNLGMRPTFDGKRIMLESHLLDYSGPELYGQQVEVFLSHFIRPEIKFDSPDALRNQIAEDVKKAKEFHGKHA